ncbi:MAG TPA: hypothetical protein VK249_25495 [Anaerolineales bacterium]|nr:hypothetical protein [Anaerolineales bacterium]
MPRNRADYLADTKPNQRLTDLLSESEKAIREGNSQTAYELALQATQAAPENIEAWLLRASVAPSLEERLICVNHLNELMPGYEDRHHVAFFALQELLDKNPFLAYLEETEELYHVLDADRMVLVIPKKRAAVNSSAHERPRALKAAYRLLLVAVLGLMLAGIGTLIFAPLSALAAIQAGSTLRSREDRVSSTVVLILSILLFFIGAAFTFLFVIHLAG